MEWNNPKSFHTEWINNWRYFPQIAKGINCKIPIIWTDSIAFQKFQRYVHSEYELEEYIEYLKTHLNNKENRFFSLYSNDVEIFDYRPGRYHTEVAQNNISEWTRIFKLFEYLKQNDAFQSVFPSEVLRGLSLENIV